MTCPRLRLRKGREKATLHRHPWIFSGAVESVEGDPAPGDLVRVVDSGDAFLAWGHYSPSSQIRVRLLSWLEGEEIGEAWWRRKLDESIERRSGMYEADETDSCRLVHAEADFLPGLVVDRYADIVVLQALTPGVDRLKGMIASELSALLGAAAVFERSDAEVRRLEGLEPVVGLLTGAEPPETVTIREEGCSFLVDVRHGQKTGFYLDQRENRRIVGRHAAGRRVLDCFAYTGGFGVHAALSGASSIELVDSSGPALALASLNMSLNGVSAGAFSMVEEDAFHYLRQCRDRARTFDLIILDPPRLAPTRAHAAAASRAYKDANLLAMKLLSPGGILATFSCSAGIDAAFFREILSWAATDAGREVQIVERLAQGPDHPVRLSFPESEYLKGFICRVV